VPQLRRALRDKIAGRGFDDAAVELAATEAITNVVRHAYPTSGPVTLSLEASAGDVLVIVADEGTWSRNDTTGKDPGHGGLGLALIHELCASARIEPTNTGTTVTMRFTKNHDDPR
jgi:anti-sigma regulatory factor (Ser/Thr protein kinase)